EAAGMLCEEMGAQVEDGSVKEAITELTSYSMVTRKGESFTVHRMVQDALRSRIPEERRRGWIKEALKVVDQFTQFEEQDVERWPVWNLMRPHMDRVTKHAEALRIYSPTTSIMMQLATLLKIKALYREAEPLVRRILEIDEDSFGPQHPNVAA